jgi:hypothetical protein
MKRPKQGPLIRVSPPGLHGEESVGFASLRPLCYSAHRLLTLRGRPQESPGVIDGGRWNTHSCLPTKSAGFFSSELQTKVPVLAAHVISITDVPSRGRASWVQEFEGRKAVSGDSANVQSAS